jgi:nitroimidazol reductase NimA-like FMN-containing flavoprotein (pyridoxamine 5'-phosphate oxidase superfamily)
MIDTRGPWAWKRVESYLRDTVVPARVACLSHTGWPIVLSLWYLYRDGVLWCASQSDSRVIQRLREDPRCAFEIAPNEQPYCGVRGQGRATTDAARGVEILRALLARYFGSEEALLHYSHGRRKAAQAAVNLIGRARTRACPMPSCGSSQHT